MAPHCGFACSFWAAASVEDFGGTAARVDAPSLPPPVPTGSGSKGLEANLDLSPAAPDAPGTIPIVGYLRAHCKTRQTSAQSRIPTWLRFLCPTRLFPYPKNGES